MQELTMNEVNQVAGGRQMSGPEAAGLILGLAAFGGPIVIGIGLGAAGGLLAAWVFA